MDKILSTYNHGLCLFSFTKVDTFEGYKNPIEEIYNFNIASIK